MQRSTVLVLIVLAAVVAFGVVARGSDQPGEPRFADGTSTAATIGVAGPDGEPIVCANGKELRVPLTRLLGPPNVTPAAAAREALLTPRLGEDRVWRCGSGARPDLNARLVPASEDPLTSARTSP
ncbi:MAG TPA: hypothetical protein VH683_01525 [Thermoleophilaceae bacterium]|jgi:hypothetical protein